MKKGNRGSSRGTLTSRRRVLLAASTCALLLLLLEGPIPVQCWPADPDWNLLADDGNDVPPKWAYLDIRNVYYYGDQSYVYFRMQLQGTPGWNGGTIEGRYKVLMDTDMDGDWDYLVYVEDRDDDGNGEAYFRWDSDDDGKFNDETDTAADIGFRLVTGNYVDEQVALSDIGLSQETQVNLEYNTDTEKNNIDINPTDYTVVFNNVTIPTLGLILFIGMISFVVALVGRRKKSWLLYYLGSVFGLTIILIGLAALSGFDLRLESIEASQVHSLASSVGVPIHHTSHNVIVLKGSDSWSVLEVGLECSAIIEISALLGLLLFYPKYPPLKKVLGISLGAAATYALNLVRLLLIVFLIGKYGPGFAFIAHAVIGRLFFFGAVLVVFWSVLTRPTLTIVQNLIEKRFQATMTDGGEAEDA